MSEELKATIGRIAAKPPPVVAIVGDRMDQRRQRYLENQAELFQAKDSVPNLDDICNCASVPPPVKVVPDGVLGTDAESG